MEIITREEAKKRGLATFFTGKPCKHGHVAEQYVRPGGGCKRCQQLRANEYTKKCREERTPRAKKQGSSRNTKPTIEGARLIKGMCQSGSE